MGTYDTHIKRDERIAAEVESFRQARFPGIQTAAHPPPRPGEALYPILAYRPSRGFLKRLRTGLRP
ncbi:MAG: hypothetical protein PVF91_04080 [Chromatiales bacterium]|jgi:hypothetical protein